MSVKFEHQFNLKNYNAYRVESKCSKAWFPQNEEDLLNIYKDRADIKKIILGNGNNIILSKDYYEEEFIILNGCFNYVDVNNNIMIAESGATLEQLSETALSKSLSGLEIFYDIPSSIGGAVVMNAGTKDGEIKDLLLKVRYLDLSDLKIKEIDKEDIGFEYRNSFFQKNTDKIVLKAWFELEYGDKEDIKRRMDDYKAIRWLKQPREFPNCGSVFKRPKGRFVGPMLDELGLKGFTIGGAQVSEKHSGFIVNKGEATGEEILTLIKEIQRRVKDKFDVELEIEQRVI